VRALLDRGRLAEARTLADRIDRVAGASEAHQARALVLKAEVAAAGGEMSQARLADREGRQLAPQDLPTQLARVRMLLAVGDRLRVQQELTQLVRLAPDDPEVLALQAEPRSGRERGRRDAGDRPPRRSIDDDRGRVARLRGEVHAMRGPQSPRRSPPSPPRRPGPHRRRRGDRPRRAARARRAALRDAALATARRDPPAPARRPARRGPPQAAGARAGPRQPARRDRSQGPGDRRARRGPRRRPRRQRGAAAPRRAGDRPGPRRRRAGRPRRGRRAHRRLPRPRRVARPPVPPRQRAAVLLAALVQPHLSDPARPTTCW
jgi:hypothetical protein